jgi:hypothetical protein
MEDNQVEHDFEPPPVEMPKLPPVGESGTDKIDNSEAARALAALRDGKPLQGDESTK